VRQKVKAFLEDDAAPKGINSQYKVKKSCARVKNPFNIFKGVFL
jgi:hypothetical protein